MAIAPAKRSSPSFGEGRQTPSRLIRPFSWSAGEGKVLGHSLHDDQVGAGFVDARGEMGILEDRLAFPKPTRLFWRAKPARENVACSSALGRGSRPIAGSRRSRQGGNAALPGCPRCPGPRHLARDRMSREGKTHQLEKVRERLVDERPLQLEDVLEAKGPWVEVKTPPNSYRAWPWVRTNWGRSSLLSPSTGARGCRKRSA
jgi:hypothetical protein